MAESNERLTVKVGRSAQRATSDAAREALAPLVGAGLEYRLVLVYGSIKHKHASILDAVRRQLGDVPLIGCTTTGEIATEGILKDGLVIAGLASEQLEAGVGFAQGVFSRPAAAAREAVGMAQKQLAARGGPDRRHQICILHTAGFTLDQPGVEEDVLAAAREALGEEWIVLGGSSSDGARFLGSRELCGDRVLEQSVVLALVSTDLEVHHAMEHGFVPTERSFPITEVKGYQVKRIDGRIARDFYADLLGVKKKQLTKGVGLIRMTDKVPKFLTAMTQKAGLTPQMITDNIPFFSYSLEHPFGVRSDDSFVVKVPKLITPEGWLEFQTRMDGVDRLWEMKLDPEATINASAGAVSAVGEAAADHPPKVVIVFECLGRYMYLMKQLDALSRKLVSATDAELVGFFSSAEQGTMEGVSCQTHNYTTSVLGLG